MLPRLIPRELVSPTSLRIANPWHTAWLFVVIENDTGSNEHNTTQQQPVPDMQPAYTYHHQLHYVCYPDMR